MKKKSMVLFATLLLIACTQGIKTDTPGTLSGKWNNITRQDGRQFEFIAHFKPDSTYDGILNGKVLVSGGSYKEYGDTVEFRDHVCNIGYIGKYRLHYVGDSVYFQLITDTCTLRRMGTDGVGMKRMAK